MKPSWWIRMVGAVAGGGAAVAALCLSSSCSTIMPGDSFRGELPLITAEQVSLTDQLRRDVEMLAGTIGERNVAHPEKLAAAEHFLAASLAKAGYVVRWQTYDTEGVACSNLEVELRGTERPDEILIVGAHYDANKGSPSANDNASGTAAVLALARAFAGKPMARTVRFVLFVNEEPPYFWTDQMGSLVYARSCKAKGESIVGMLSLETIGYFSDEKGSQNYPPLFDLAYPDTGNFVAFVGMSSAEPFIKECVAAFREGCTFPSEGAALPTLVPRVGSSDHWSFWKQGYPSLMVTDTAPYRYKHYHKPTDTPEKLNYECMARVVEGLEVVVRSLGNKAGAPVQ